MDPPDRIAGGARCKQSPDVHSTRAASLSRRVIAFVAVIALGDAMRDSSLQPKRLWAELATVGVLVGLTAWASLALARGPGGLVAIWIGNGLLTGWLSSRPTALWWRYVVVGFAADLAAHLFSGFALFHAGAISLSNLAEVLIVAGVVRHWVPDISDPKRWLTLGGFATSSTLVACLVSGLLPAWIAARHSGAYFQPLLSWYAAHVVGMVTMATFTLVLLRERIGVFFSGARRRWSFAACLLLLCVVAVAVFLSEYPVMFMAYPPLLLLAFRHRFLGVGAGIVSLALIGSIATALGYGPIWLPPDIGLFGRIALLQLYVAGGCLITIPVALAVAERRRLTARIRQSEHRYRLLADYSHDIILHMRADGERLYISPSAKDILGWEPGELLGRDWGYLHAEDRGQLAEQLGDVINAQALRTSVYRFRHKAGHYVWLEAAARPILREEEPGQVDIIVVGRDVTRRIEAERALEESRRELERLARTDPLTGVANRRYFQERLDQALSRLARRDASPLALLYLDVDDFKQINDRHGHGIGDLVLRIFAQQLQDHVRATDLVARFGGDEFAVLLEDTRAVEVAEVVARKLVTTIGGLVIPGLPQGVTTSLGGAYARQPVDAAALLAVADAALYEAKQAGRNTYRLRSADRAGPASAIA